MLMIIMNSLSLRTYLSAKVQELGGEIIFDGLELSQIAENRSTVIQILNQINFDG